MPRGMATARPWGGRCRRSAITCCSWPMKDFSPRCRPREMPPTWCRRPSCRLSAACSSSVDARRANGGTGFEAS